MNKVRLSIVIVCITLLWSWSFPRTELALAAPNAVPFPNYLAGSNACGSVGNDSSPTVFPTLDLSNCPQDSASPPPRKPWQPIKVDPGSTCVDWLLYHTNQSGNWNVFRF